MKRALAWLSFLGPLLLIAVYLVIVWLVSACGHTPTPVRPASVKPEPIVIYMTVDDLLADLMDDLDEIERLQSATHTNVGEVKL